MTGDIKIPLEVVPESTKEEALNPSANLVGQAFRGALHIVLDPFVKLNIIRDKALKDFEEKIHTKNEAIPIENRDDTKIGLALKALEDSKYQLNSEELREMFSNLISATLDNRVNNKVQPSFSTILKDLSPEDARLFLNFTKSKAFPLVTIRLEVENDSTGVAYAENILLIQNNIINQPLSVSSLERLGIITIFENNKLQSHENLKAYSDFKSSELYTEAQSTLPIELDGVTLSKITVNEGSAKLTELGRNLLQILI